MIPMSTPPAYTEVKSVLDIQAGSRYVWAATEKGLLVYEQQTGRFRCVDASAALPGQSVYAVSAEPGRADTVWLVTCDKNSKPKWTNYLVRLTLPTLSAKPSVQSWVIPSEPPNPYLTLQQYGTVVRLDVRKDRVRVKTDGALWDWKRSANAATQWTVTKRTQAEMEDWERNYSIGGFAGIIQQVFTTKDGRAIYLRADSGSNMLEYRTSDDRLSFFNPVSPSEAGDMYSIPFHLRVDKAANLMYDVVATRMHPLPGDLAFYSYALMTWRRAPEKKTGWSLVARRPVTPAELPTLRAAAGHSISSPFPLAPITKLYTLAYDRAHGILWAGGDGGLVRYRVMPGKK